MSGASHALSNLRGTVIVAVLAFHSSLAYLASAPAPTLGFNQAPYAWRAFPIVDSTHWLGFDIFCAWLDVSLMALMFFLSGLFTASSLSRKGSLGFFSDRLWRIGLPFALAVTFLSPLAHYPAYSQRAVDPSLTGYWQQWFSLPFWPSGPEWFLWQLLGINAVAALMFLVAPRSLELLNRFAGWACARPVKLFTLLAAASVIVYVPFALAYSPWRWSAVGPFSFQICRPMLYLVFFFAALAIGSRGLDRGLLRCDGPLARNWPAWLAIAAGTFMLWAGLTWLTQPDWSEAPWAARVGSSLAYAIACPAGVLFIIAASLRLAQIRLRALDSLSANAYGMYLIHYVFIVWLQYALLGIALPAIVKAMVVLGIALALSWTITSAYYRLARGLSGLGLGRIAAPVHR